MSDFWIGFWSGVASGAFLLAPAQVISRFCQRMDRRDAVIQDWIGQINRLADRGVHYWFLDGCHSEVCGLEVLIKSDLQRLSKDLTSVPRKLTGYSQLRNRPIVALRRALTSSPFEERDRKAEAWREDSIRLAARDLVDEIIDQKRWWH